MKLRLSGNVEIKNYGKIVIAIMIKIIELEYKH